MNIRTPQIRKHVHTWSAHTRPWKVKNGQLLAVLTGDDADPVSGLRLLHRACDDCGRVEHTRTPQRALEDLPAVCKYYLDATWLEGESEPRDKLHFGGLFT